MSDMKIEGAEELMRKLKLLPQRLGRNAMRRALRRGANVVRNAARNNAKRIDDPESREQIWKNIVVAPAGSKVERQQNAVIMRVGVRGGARHREGGALDGNPGGNTTHWRWIEFGTSTTPAVPFMRPALANNAAAAMDTVASSMRTEMEKELAKL